MNIFDVIGPVMIGPSSSHTAGAVRLSLLAISILGAWPVKAQIALHGSFAQTYRAMARIWRFLRDLMGWLPDDARISARQWILLRSRAWNTNFPRSI